MGRPKKPIEEKFKKKRKQNRNSKYLQSKTYVPISDGIGAYKGDNKKRIDYCLNCTKIRCNGKCDELMMIPNDFNEGENDG